jgi:predicted nucleotidyltransferase
MYTNEYFTMKILALFVKDYSKELYLREIGRDSSLSLKSTQNVLAKLEKENILKSRINGKNKYFSLNLQNPLTKLFLVKAEIFKTMEFLEKYPLLKPFLKDINNNIPLVVFGSYARLEATKSSDIDILIISSMKILEKNPFSFELIPIKIHEVKISEENFDLSVKSNEALIKEIQEHHVILNNHSVYVSTMWKHAKH